MIGQPSKDDFLITTMVDGKSWHWLWDHPEPMGIDHPSLWELHRTASGAKFVHRETGDVVDVTASQLMGLADVSLPKTSEDSRELTVHFKKIQRIRPAYMPDLSALKNVGKADHYLSAGIREHLISFTAVENKLVGRVEDEKIFEVRREATFFTISAKRTGLRFKPTGQPSRPLEPNQKHNFAFSEIYGGAFVYGSFWWRFNKVPTPEMMNLDELDREEAAQDLISLRQLGKAITGFVAVAVALVVGTHYVQQYQESKKPKPAAVAVELKKPKLILAEKPKPTPAPKLVKKPEPTPAPKKVAEKPKPKPKEKPKAKVAKKPKPKPAPKVAKRPEPPKPAPAPKVAHKPKAPPQVAVAPPPPARPAKPAPVAPKVPDAAVVAAQQKAAVAKSLNFLSTGPSKAVNALATHPNAKVAAKYQNAGTGAVPANTTELSKLATANTGAGGPITTKGSRSLAAAGLKGAHGKGLNQVQGKVSLNALYGSGSGDSLAAAAGGGGMSVSGPGKISDADIEKTLSKYLHKLQFCYEKALLTDSSLGGTISIKWKINSNGSVSGQAVTRSEMNHSGLHDCLMREFGKMKFPQPKGGSVDVKKPFKFEASSL